MISTGLFYISFVIYAAAAALITADTVRPSRLAGVTGELCLYTGLAAHFSAIGARWAASSRIPIISIYETLLFFSWLIILISAFLNRRREIKAAVIAALGLALLAFGAASVLPDACRQTAPLLPVLKSGWLWVHVTACFAAYAFFTVAFICALVQLFSRRNTLKELMDLTQYRMIAPGFCLLTFGILSGSLWAEKAWGSYWSWDPKETWSLITWLIYAGYLHARITSGWNGRKSAWLSVLGFAAVIFTYIGVSFLMNGLHSYR